MNNAGRVMQVAVVSCLVSLAAQSQDTSNAEAGWAAIGKCAAIKDDDARHACSDDVLRKAGLLPGAEAAAETKSADSRKRFGLQRPTTDAASRHDEQLEVTLASVDQGGDGKLVLTTTDGAVWRQAESDAIRPPPVRGQTLTIAKRSFGGFMCKSSRYVAFRCFRSR